MEKQNEKRKIPKDKLKIMNTVKSLLIRMFKTLLSIF